LVEKKSGKTNYNPKRSDKTVTTFMAQVPLYVAPHRRETKDTTTNLDLQVREQVECWLCHKTGHVGRDCFQRREKLTCYGCNGK